MGYKSLVISENSKENFWLLMPTKKKLNIDKGLCYILLFLGKESLLTVNSIWGVSSPLTEKKFVKKNGKCNQDYFLLVLPKSS